MAGFSGSLNIKLIPEGSESCMSESGISEITGYELAGYDELHGFPGNKR